MVPRDRVWLRGVGNAVICSMIARLSSIRTAQLHQPISDQYSIPHGTAVVQASVSIRVSSDRVCAQGDSCLRECNPLSTMEDATLTLIAIGSVVKGPVNGMCAIMPHERPKALPLSWSEYEWSWRVYVTASERSCGVQLPEAFVGRITGTFGSDGARWLARLPTLLTEIANRWELILGPPFELSYNYVIPVQRTDGTPAVLKLGVVRPELLNEIDALRHFAGRGACRLLAADETVGALLLEHLHPGQTLVAFAEADDEAATRAAAHVMARLWAPPPPNHRYRSVADLARSLADLRPHYGGTTGPFSAALIERAESLFAELLAAQEAPVVLHGDLHHLNILAAGPDEWRAIDPQGLIGEPAYEIGALMRNPAPGIGDCPDLARVLQRRIAIFAETLGLDQHRIHGWALAHTVLNAWWSVEVAPEIYAADLVVVHALASLPG